MGFEPRTVYSNPAFVSPLYFLKVCECMWPGVGKPSSYCFVFKDTAFHYRYLGGYICRTLYFLAMILISSVQIDLIQICQLTVITHGNNFFLVQDLIHDLLLHVVVINLYSLLFWNTSFVLLLVMLTLVTWVGWCLPCFFTFKFKLPVSGFRICL